MTDEEIIMGLTQCIGVDGSCRVCPYWDKCEYENNDVMLKDVWDLINRQQAEIERLQGMVDAELDTIHDLGDDYERMLEEEEELIQKAKAEAYKEFWDKLKQEADFISGGDYGLSFEIREDVAEDIIKEVAGE